MVASLVLVEFYIANFRNFWNFFLSCKECRGLAESKDEGEGEKKGVSMVESWRLRRTGGH